MNENNMILKITKVHKFYDKFPAVKNVQLHIKKGEIYALLGHNGAGKSTLIKMILGLVKPSAGHIQIEGLSYDDKNREIKRKIGYLPERMNFYDNLTAWETITFYAKLKGSSQKRCENVLEQVGLAQVKHRRVGAFSKGMQQRLGLAQAIIHKPDLLVLDEPTTGLDPMGIIEFKKMIRQWNEEGTTIFFSSHNLNDVEELAQQVGIMHNGELIAQGTIKELQKQLSLVTKMEIQLTNNSINLSEDLMQEKIGKFKRAGDTIITYCAGDKKVEVFKNLIEEGIDIQDLRLEEPGLNLIYQHIMEQFNS